MLYVERISFHSFFFFVIPFLLKGLLNKNNGIVQYFSCPYFFEKYVIKLFKGKLTQFDFEIREIRDENGECVISKILRKDAISFVDKIISCKSFKKFIIGNEQKNSFAQYVIKSIVGRSIPIEYGNTASLNYNLLLIKRVHENNKLLKIKHSDFVFLNRPWFEYYNEYGLQYGIKILKSYHVNINVITILKSLVTTHPRLALFLKALKNYVKYRANIKGSKLIKRNTLQRILFQGLGEFNLKKNGYNSDFFFYLYSPLEVRYLSSFYETLEQKDALFEEGIIPINPHNYSFKNKIINCVNPINDALIKGSSFKESSFIENSINNYLLCKLEWANLFLLHNIKLFVSWYKFGSVHIAKHDAINEIGGVSAIWDRSFEGEPNLNFMTVSDINFTYSDYNYYNHHSLLNSKISYNVITGYLRDYSLPYANRPSLNGIRQKLQKNGAELIISFFDQNSVDDYGHNRERESYKHLLEALFENPWLGIIFKPKKPKTVRERLGEEISELIDKAITSGRCYIFEESGPHQSNVPVVFASIIGDISIHNALYAGTAALESALAGKPTILLDTVGHPFNRLYELGKNKVVFTDLAHIIDIIIDYYKLPNGIPEFGNWSEKINRFDPFGDGRGSYRMGSYIQSIMSGFEKKMNRSDVLERAADIYSKEWGADKILRGE